MLYRRDDGGYGLLKQTDRETVAGYFRSGKGNAEIAEQLAKTYAGAAETMELQTGDTADYFASAAGLEINIHDKFGTTMEQGWTDIAATLRTVYQLGQDGLTHEPVQPMAEQEHLEPAQTVLFFKPKQKQFIPARKTTCLMMW